MRSAAKVLHLLWAVPIALSVCGCASTYRDADDFADKPLPYSVGIYFDRPGSSVPNPLSGDIAGEEPRFQRDGQDVVLQLQDQLVADGIVSRAVALQAGGIEEAKKLAKKYDYLFIVTLSAPESYGQPERPIGTAALEVGAWLFGGIGSWFTPSLSYTADTEMRILVVDMNDPDPTKVGDHRIKADTGSISLWDRADFNDDIGDYALTIVVPPMFVTPDDALAESEAVTTDVLDDIHGQLDGSFKDGLVQAELARKLRVAFLDPCGGSSLDGAVFGPTLEIVSEGGVEIKALDLHRLAKDVDAYRWKATADQLQKLNQGLPEGEPGRVSIGVPVEEFPLVPGTNLIKVRALRTDGVRVSRTVVYEYEG